MNRDRPLRDLRWLAEGNPRYAGTDEEGKQNPTVAHFSRNVSGVVPTQQPRTLAASVRALEADPP